jgi:hypothetical protein
MMPDNEQPPSDCDSRQDQIRVSAYYKWLQAGGPDGRQLDFWCEAEREYAVAQTDTAAAATRRSGHREVIVRPKALPAPAPAAS